MSGNPRPSATLCEIPHVPVGACHSFSLYEERRLTVHSKTPTAAPTAKQADQKNRVKATGSKSSGRLLNGNTSRSWVGISPPLGTAGGCWVGVPLRPWVASSSWVGAVPPLSLKVTLVRILGCISQRYSYVPGLRESEAGAVGFFNSLLWS